MPPVFEKKTVIIEYLCWYDVYSDCCQLLTAVIMRNRTKISNIFPKKKL